MIQSIEFTNFKALQKTTLPLAPFTLLLGPNGSGKTSVLQAIQGIATSAARVTGPSRAPGADWSGFSHSASLSHPDAAVEIKLQLQLRNQMLAAAFAWPPGAQQPEWTVTGADGNPVPPPQTGFVLQWLARMQSYFLDFWAIAQPVAVNSGPLAPNGYGLVAVLDDLKDNHPERWEALLAELGRWLPEYDYILFDKPQPGQKGIVLRTRKGGHRIPAGELSQGTLIGLALLTLAYLPEPPSVVGLEEIDRGLHPRLLRHLQDALYRLSYPDSCGESRPPVQVIATTHSPYLLDLYRDHPEEVVLAHKGGLEVQMHRLTDIEHYQEILGDAPLSEVWYSGVLGGVSVKP